MKFSSKFLTLALFFLLISLNAWAGPHRVSVGDVQGSGLSDRKLESVRSLIKSEVMEHEDTRLVERGGEMEIEGEINRFEYSYLVILTAKKDGEFIRSRKAKMSNFDEIDVVIKRLVAAILENKKVEETAERGAVLEKEQRDPTVVKATSGYELSLGGAVPFTNALLSHQPMYAISMGYLWNIDKFLLEGRADFQGAFNDIDTSSISTTIGGHYIWHETRQVSLFSGLELGFAHLEDDRFSGKSGFATGFDIGALLFRHANINVDVRFRTMILADKFNRSVPVVGSLMVGLIF